MSQLIYKTVGQIERLLWELYLSISTLDEGLSIPELISDSLDSLCYFGVAPTEKLDGALALAASGLERMKELGGALAELSDELEDRLCRYSV